MRRNVSRPHATEKRVALGENLLGLFFRQNLEHFRIADRKNRHNQIADAVAQIGQRPAVESDDSASDDSDRNGDRALLRIRQLWAVFSERSIVCRHGYTCPIPSL